MKLQCIWFLSILLPARLSWASITTYFTTILICQPLAEIVYSDILWSRNHWGTIVSWLHLKEVFYSRRVLKGTITLLLLRVVTGVAGSHHVGWWLSEVQGPKVPLPPSRAAPSTYNLGRVNEIPGRSSLEEHSSSVSPCSLELRPRIPHRPLSPPITHVLQYLRMSLHWWEVLLPSGYLLRIFIPNRVFLLQLVLYI